MRKLPRNWIEVTLADVASKGQYGWTTKAANSGLIKYLRTTDITHKHINWERVPYCSQTPIDIEKYEVQSGDILISRTGSVGYSILIENVPFRAVFASYLIRFVPSAEVNARYLYHFLQSQNYWHQIYQVSSGIAVANVNAKKMANIILPIAPLAEQKRIADKLDTLLARVDACQALLSRVRVILKNFRQAVLAAATSGELTADWRESQRHKFNWQKVYLTDVGQIGRGKSRHRPRNDPQLYGGPYPFIQTGDIAQSGERITTHTQTYNELGLSQSKLWPTNTVCITIAANIAKTAILSYPACFPDSVVGFIANPKKSLPQLIKWNIDVIQNRLDSFAKGTAQKNINLAVLNSINLNCPPIDEQHEIVRRVETLFAFADGLQRHTEVARTKVEGLTPALLDKAFRGKLVPQDPNDEPASVLLERIRAERSMQPDKPKRTRRTKRSKMTKNSVKKAILELPEDYFSFDELRHHLAGDYDKLKDIIFALLNETEPSMTQLFDETLKTILFVRNNK